MSVNRQCLDRLTFVELQRGHMREPPPVLSLTETLTLLYIFGEWWRYQFTGALCLRVPPGP